MNRFLLKLAVVIFVLWAAVPVALAQNTQPTIVTFSADPAALTVDAAESGTFETTLSWAVIHMTDGQRLVLQRRSLGDWVSVLADDETLPAVGTRTVPVQHPLDFDPPSYRLVLVGADGQLVDERFLALAYEVPPDLRPEITLFTTSTPTISGDPLADGSARVSVSWAIRNRLPTSNLIFEQVLDADRAVLVELPRDNLWIASRGDGVVAPVAPALGSVIRLRLRVVDVLTEEVYAESEVEVVVAGIAAAVVPTATEAAALVADDSITPEPSPTPRNCSISAVDVPLNGAPGDGCDTYRDSRSGTTTAVTAFSLDNPNPTPGRPVTLTWTVAGAQFALIEVYDPNQLAQGGLPEPAVVLYDGLPTSGSTTVTLPANMTDGARFILWAANLSTDARSPSFLYDRLAYRIIDTGAIALQTDAEITAFVALPPTVAPGGEVTLSWSLNGADAALIELYNRASNASAGVFEDLPTIGSANIVIPETFTQGARFVLWAANRAPDGSYVRLVQSAVEVPAG
ncbi:MAG: hypothetical protein K8J31_28795 [Anaerolineae bacterium]|nr:hypothetical protein [Anaerolineae bacterium]